MDWLLEGLQWASSYIRPHISSIATVLVSTLLVIYGSEINHFVKRLLRSRHIAWRYLAFILLCSFGYGFILFFLAPLLAEQLRLLSSLYLSPCVLALFIALAVLAERKKQI